MEDSLSDTLAGLSITESPFLRKTQGTSAWVPPTPCTPYVPPRDTTNKENTPNVNNEEEIKAKKRQFNKLVLEAREFEANNNLSSALRRYAEARDIAPDENVKLDRKINNLKRAISGTPAKKPLADASNMVSSQPSGEPSRKKVAPVAVKTPKVESETNDSPPVVPALSFRPTVPAVSTGRTKDEETKSNSDTLKGATTSASTKGERSNKPVETVPSKGGDKGEKALEANGQTLQRDGYWHDSKDKAYLLKSDDERELSVNEALYKHLYPHQHDGLKWMWGLYLKGDGGILGDDMGLGKTMQVVGFIGSMIRSGNISHALIVMPVSVLEHWKQEFEQWGERVRVKVYHGTSVKEREENLDRVKSRGGVLLTTYGMVLNQTKKLASLKWDYIIFDEGHKIKDMNAKISQSARELRASNKILLSGTPIQNNLKEMYALFDWACDGKLLGNFKSFKVGYEAPIVRGLDRNATLGEKQIGESVSAALMKFIAPFFLRRDKKTLFGKKSPAKSNNPNPPSQAPVPSSPSSAPISTPAATTSPTSTSTSTTTKAAICTTRKNDLVVWLKLSDPQLRLYEDFLGSDQVRLVLNQTQSHLAALTRLKQICTHPCLLTQDTAAKSLAFHSANSAKIAFLAGLIPQLKAEGHRLLIFSQYTTMLDVIQSCVIELGCKFVRIDGSIASTAERERRIKMFNKNKDIFCFLLTTGAGALGINLTSADRVLIFDPSWNTNDNQAVDRVYRVGQTRDVVIYRLILCGTIDEKMYRKQVFKSALQGMMKAGSQYRYFTKQELSEMFVLDDHTTSATQYQLAQLHDHNVKSYPYLDEHIRFLHDSLGIVGVSHHDLLFSERPEDLEQSEAGQEVAARSMNSLFTEPAGKGRRRGPAKTSTPTPRRKPKNVVVLDDDDGYDDDDYGYDVGARLNPISLDDEENGEEDSENIENSEGEENPENVEEMESNEQESEKEEPAKNFRRLRKRVVVDSDDEDQEEASGINGESSTAVESEDTTEDVAESEECEEKEQPQVESQQQEVETTTGEHVHEATDSEQEEEDREDREAGGQEEEEQDSLEVLEVPEIPKEETQANQEPEVPQVKEIDDENEKSLALENENQAGALSNQTTSCETHRRAVAPFMCHQCSCFLSPKQAQIYSEALQEAKTCHKGNRLDQALLMYMKALFICSEELQLHACILSLHAEMKDC